MPVVPVVFPRAPLVLRSPRDPRRTALPRKHLRTAIPVAPALSSCGVHVPRACLSAPVPMRTLLLPVDLLVSPVPWYLRFPRHHPDVRRSPVSGRRTAIPRGGALPGFPCVLVDPRAAGRIVAPPLTCCFPRALRTAPRESPRRRSPVSGRRAAIPRGGAVRGPPCVLVGPRADVCGVAPPCPLVLRSPVLLRSPWRRPPCV